MTPSSHAVKLYPCSDPNLNAENVLSDEQLDVNHRLLEHVSHTMGMVSFWPIGTRVVMPDYGAHSDILFRLECALTPKKPLASRQPYTTLVKVAPTTANIDLILRTDPALRNVFRYDTFTRKVYLTRDSDLGVGGPFPRLFDEHDPVFVAAWIGRRYGINITGAAIHDILKTIALEDKFNSYADFMLQCHADWKAAGSPRLLHRVAADILHNPSAFAQIAVTKTLIAKAARALRGENECRVESVLILEGAQGCGKSTFARILGGSSYADAHLKLNEPDQAAFQLIGKSVYEVAELVTMRKHEADDLKSFISIDSDCFRPKFARDEITYHRQCIFIGTINPNGQSYLKDTTGSRRFWVVECAQKIAHEVLKEQITLLNGEAVHHYLCGEKWYLDTLEEDEREAINDERTISDESAPEVLDAIVHDVRFEHLRVLMLGAGATTAQVASKLIPNFDVTDKRRLDMLGRTLGALVKDGHLFKQKCGTPKCHRYFLYNPRRIAMQ